MRISTLSGMPIAAVVEVFLRAFENYFVPLPQELAYWEDRFQSAGVDLSCSYGAFEGDELIAFVIHAIGVSDGGTVAYNTGTGVLPAFRGRRLVDLIHEMALPICGQGGSPGSIWR